MRRGEGYDPRHAEEALAQLDRITGKTRLDKSATDDLVKDLAWLRGRRSNAAYEVRKKLDEVRHLDQSIERLESVLKGRGVTYIGRKK